MPPKASFPLIFTIALLSACSLLIWKAQKQAMEEEPSSSFARVFPGQEMPIPLSSKVYQALPELRLGQTVSLSLGVETYQATLQKKLTSKTSPNAQQLLFDLGEPESTELVLSYKNGKLESGRAFLDPKSGTCARIINEQGQLRLNFVPMAQLICGRPTWLKHWREAQHLVQAMPPEPGYENVPPVGEKPAYNLKAASIPLLESLPGANDVLYLDFDGEVVTTFYWNSGNTINAAPATYSPSQITDIWTTVSEDFSPFDINVTTDVSVYNTASKRQKVIITPTDYWAPGYAGIAYTNTYNDDSIPAWVFTNNISLLPSNVGAVIAHESGHTLGLSHDGTSGNEYYTGHFANSASWAPIMGAGYSRPLIQWSKGEYPDANNTENDTLILASKVGYNSDSNATLTWQADAEGYLHTATWEESPGNFVTPEGLLHKTTDSDGWSLSHTTGGILEATVNPLENFGNADLRLYLVPANHLASASPQIRRDGEEADRLDSVFVNEPIIPNEELALQVSPGASGADLSFDPAAGYSNYGSLGTYSIDAKIHAHRPPFHQKLFGGMSNSIIVATNGEANWYEVPSPTNPVTDALASGSITKEQESALHLIIDGPGVLTYNYRVSSNENIDHLRIYIGETEAQSYSGESQGVEQNLSIPGGQQHLRFVYERGTPTNGVGEDTAHLANFTWTPNTPVYNTWAAQSLISDLDPTDDPDGDGLSNLEEFAYGLDPTSPSHQSTGVPCLDPLAEIYTFSIPAYDGSGSLTWQIESSPDLQTWTPVAQNDTTQSAHTLPAYSLITLPFSTATFPSYFYRTNLTLATITSTNSTMSLTGDFPQSSVEMALVEENLWQADLTFTSQSSINFTFVPDSSLPLSRGEGDQSDFTSPLRDISENTTLPIQLNGPLDGTYRFTLDMATGEYRVKKIADN